MISLLLPIETAEKIRKLDQKSVAWCLTPCFSFAVPDAPDPDKEILGIRIERTLKKRIEAAAKQRGQTITEFCRDILVAATSNISLSAKDYEDIAKKVREAEAKLNKRKP
jgi:uncharacterized protein (DUF1778 family)